MKCFKNKYSRYFIVEIIDISRKTDRFEEKLYIARVATNKRETEKHAGKCSFNAV